MIHLEVEKYCNGCVCFEADVISPTVYYSNDEPVFQTSTVIKCAHRNRCANAVKNVLRMKKDGKENGESSI